MRLRLAALVVLLAIQAALSAGATPRRQGAERPLNPKASAFHNDGKQVYLALGALFLLAIFAGARLGKII